MKKEGCWCVCVCVCGRSCRCWQGLVVLFRLVRKCVLFTFKNSYLKTAPRIVFLGVHSMFTRLSLSWLKGRLCILFHEGTESFMVALSVCELLFTGSFQPFCTLPVLAPPSSSVQFHKVKRVFLCVLCPCFNQIGKVSSGMVHASNVQRPTYKATTIPVLFNILFCNWFVRAGRAHFSLLFFPVILF